MPVVRKVTTSNTITKKSRITKPSIRSVRNPSAAAEMGDTNFGTLDLTKDGLLVTYDSATNKFVLSTPDEALFQSASDEDIEDSFVTQLEDELDFGRVQAGDIDAGSF